MTALPTRADGKPDRRYLTNAQRRARGLPPTGRRKAKRARK
jgi:hypothetical protein